MAKRQSEHDSVPVKKQKVTDYFMRLEKSAEAAIISVNEHDVQENSILSVSSNTSNQVEFIDYRSSKFIFKHCFYYSQYYSLSVVYYASCIHLYKLLYTFHQH